MNKYAKIFAYELTNRLIYEGGFNQSKIQMSAFHKYAPDSYKVTVLSYIDECVSWYTWEELGKWVVCKLGKRFHVKLLGHAHWFMSTRISQLKNHYIS